MYSAYQYPHALAGVIALSGYLPMQRRWKENLSEANKTTKAFMGHGDCDEVVSYRWGKASHDILAANGIDVKLHTYSGMGHSACQEEIDDIAAFIASRFELSPKL